MLKKRKYAEIVDPDVAETVSAQATLKAIRCSEVPEYLREGQLFKSFNTDDGSEDEEILVPHDAMKMDDSVRSIADQSHLLCTLRYWLVDSVPLSVIQFVLENSLQMCAPVIQEFHTQFPILSPLQAVQKVPSGNRMLQAYVKGEIEIVRYLHDQGRAISAECAVLCAQRGHADCLRFYLGHDGVLPSFIERTAAEKGHLECLKIMHSHGRPMTTECAGRACEHNHVECLQFCHEHGVDLTSDHARIAARGGHLDCLKYIHERGGAWDKWTVAESVMLCAAS